MDESVPVDTPVRLREGRMGAKKLVSCKVRQADVVPRRGHRVPRGEALPVDEHLRPIALGAGFWLIAVPLRSQQAGGGG